MKYISKITASGYVLPREILTNDDLCQRFDAKKIKGISKLSGINARRIASKNVTAVDLGAESAKRMLEQNAISKDDFDMLIFASQTQDYKLPASAFLVHERLGLPQTCGAFDISMGCAAMPYVISVANGLIASGQCKKILLVFAETISKLIYEKDRSLLPLHGDGAASFVIEKSDGSCGVEFVDLGANSEGWKHLIVPDGGCRNPISESSNVETCDDSGIITTPSSLQMNGAAVFHFSISLIPDEIQKSLDKRGLNGNDFDLVLLHQANKMMLDQIYAKLDIPVEKRFFFMEEIGNLSAASTPVLLAEAIRQGKLNNSERVLFASFGVGLTWGIFSIKFDSSLKYSTSEIEF